MPPPGARREGNPGQRGGKGKGFRLAARSGSHAYKGRGMRDSEHCIPTAIGRQLNSPMFNHYYSTKDKEPAGAKGKGQEGLL